MAGRTPFDPHQADLFEGRNPLTARRDGPLSSPMRGAVSTRSVMIATLRQRARHFGAKVTAKRIRPSRAAAGSQMRRVIVKARVVRMGPTARKALLTHVRYVERDGAGQDGEAEQFFDRTSDSADGRAFVDRCSGDRHHFRLIVNPEDGQELPDLKAYARRFMAQVGRDLGTEIDWIGGAHFDTGRPHLHLLLRGKREDGRDLVIPREYVSHGLRNRARELATELLGPRRERTTDLDRDVKADGFTEFDRRILQATRGDQLQAADLPSAGAEVLVRRLTHLETEGLVVRERAGAWRIPGDFRATLTERGDSLARERAAMQAVGLSARSGEAHRLQPLSMTAGEVVAGAYVGFSPLGPRDGPQALVLDLLDGRLVHLRTPSLDTLLALDRIPEGAIVEVRAMSLAPRASDQTIAEIAAERGGRYSLEDHRQARPQDREPFIERHIRRLEAMSREGACKALGGGRFEIGPEYPDLALRADEARTGGARLEVRVLDHRPLAEQITAEGHVYLDRLLRSGRSDLIAPSGFGRELRHALSGRADHLLELGLASGNPLVLPESSVRTLYAREIQEVFAAVGRGKPVFMAEEGKRFSGVYVDRAHISSRSYAVIEDRSSVTLAPWRSALEACRGQSLSGVLRDGAVDFRFGQLASRSLGRAQRLEL